MSSKVNAFVVADSKKCIGCKACEVACFVAHNNADNTLITVGNINMPIIARLHVVDNGRYKAPVQCRQCENAPCANVCPIGAIVQEENIITINENKCVGCKSCSVACPFGAIDILPKYSAGEKIYTRMKQAGKASKQFKELSTAYKCDLCKDIGNPACVEACPKNALRIFDAEKEKQEKNIASVLNL
ncbi:4Fe-4S dicluster domain-containing protein [Clostridium sp. YIM B02505]|uniref:4Fe-4S dicluster domain-containing protein n=1 Tax=Clostridium yunnanense TaxID=2800325 RepID=A0ABS1ERU2_9CLOT|nr:4Fe-4S dicluster domain-containing protein [Clostridium yunnanense]MBK1812066.1 4Fe-4S dicluster domain-containing protein [Clostridium yunnanense]